MAEQTPKSEIQVAVFQVGQDLFALNILQIQEIARYQKVRHIPRAPDFLEGVIDLRGSDMVPIVSLYSRLGIDPSVPAEKSRFILARIDFSLVGFAVDLVKDVITIHPDQIDPPPNVGLAPEFLKGVIRTEDEIILLLNFDQILSQDEKIHMRELRAHIEQTGPEAEPKPKSKPKSKKKKPKS